MSRKRQTPRRRIRSPAQRRLVPYQRTQEMRHHEPDEPDRAGHRTALPTASAVPPIKLQT